MPTKQIRSKSLKPIPKFASEAEARAFWEEALAILDDLRASEADQIRAKLTELGPVR